MILISPTATVDRDMGGPPGYVSIREEESEQREGVAGRQVDIETGDTAETPGESHETDGSRSSEYPR